MNIEVFKASLLETEVNEFAGKLLENEFNWYFDECDEIGPGSSYSAFRRAVSDHIGLEPKDVSLVGSSVFGYSLSPNQQKTFREFTPDSDLDVVIVSPQLFASVWQEMLDAFNRGYYWVKDRHSDEIFRKFALLINGGNYPTKALKSRAKQLDGIAKQVFLKTGTTRTLKYRIYESSGAATDYHAAGLQKIKRRLENDT